MNRKSKRNLIVLLILIAVLLVIFVFLKKNEDADFMQEEAGTTEESVPVVNINKEEVTDMEFIRNDGHLPCISRRIPGIIWKRLP